MTRRTAAAAAAATMATSLRGRPSRGRYARDSSGDGADDMEGGPSNDANDESDGDSSPRASRRLRVSLPRQSAKRKVDSEDEDGDEEQDAATPQDGTDDYDVGNSGAEGSQQRGPARRGRGRPPKRGRGRPPKNRAIERLQREAADEDETDGDGAGDDTGNYSMTDVGDMTARGGDETPAMEGDNVGLRDYTLINDEYELDADPQGDTKIDSKGRLQDGREFAFHTFPSPFRPDPEVHYCLSIDAAKIGGYRDSFYFYRNNPLLIKVNCADTEKDALIERGSLSGHLRNRVVTMVAVRNVYKLHGARIIKDGRAVTDDYYEELARKSGRRPGQLVDANSENAPVPTRLMERRQEVRREIRQKERETRKPEPVTRNVDLQGLAGLQERDGTTTFGDTGESPFERAKTWNTRRQNSLRTEINETTWMMEMARMVRGMNAELLAGRTERLRGFPRPYLGLDNDDESEDEKDGETKTAKDKAPPIGIYEALTNVPHYPVTTQPQAARLERVHDRPLVNGAAASNGASEASSSSTRLAVLGGAKVGPAGWGIASIEQRVQLPNESPVRNVRVPAGHGAYEQ